jgi:hypothetical protein
MWFQKFGKLKKKLIIFEFTLKKRKFCSPLSFTKPDIFKSENRPKVVKSPKLSTSGHTYKT